MTKSQYDKISALALDMAMQIVKDEHRHFIDNAIENRAHIPRIVRTAESAGKILTTDGIPKREVEANIQRIIRYGR